MAGDVVGFTSVCIAGATLDENTPRVFKPKGRKQLTRAIDDWNLKYIIAHQDVVS